MCAAEPVSLRAICGAMIPTNPIGPQNAVTAPVTMQQLASAVHLIFFGLAPERVAKLSPNSRRSSPFAPLNAMTPPAAAAAIMMPVPVSPQ